MRIRRFFIHLSYRGDLYCGWQCQSHQKSVQGEIELALSTLLRLSVQVVGAGRTDAGVHALQYYAHFDLEEDVFEVLWPKVGITKSEAYEHWVYKMNALLGKDIVVYRIFEVPLDLHARFSAVKRTYHYYIHLQKNPFLEGLSAFIRVPLEVEAMEKGAQLLIGEHDFTSFEKVHTQVKTHICKLSRAQILPVGDAAYVFIFSADRFLRNMVRAMVGSLLDIGEEKFEPEHIKEIMEAKDRCKAGRSVPACGLYLKDIRYF